MSDQEGDTKRRKRETSKPLRFGKRGYIWE